MTLCFLLRRLLFLLLFSVHHFCVELCNLLACVVWFYVLVFRDARSTAAHHLETAKLETSTAFFERWLPAYSEDQGYVAAVASQVKFHLQEESLRRRRFRLALAGALHDCWIPNTNKTQARRHAIGCVGSQVGPRGRAERHRGRQGEGYRKFSCFFA